MGKKLHKALKIDVKWAGQAAIVKLCGSAGMGEAEKLRQKLEEIVLKKPRVIVLDLGEIDFIGSAGLGAIVTGYLKSRHHGGQIRLVNPSQTVRELLETTRLTRLFEVFDSVESSLSG